MFILSYILNNRIEKWKRFLILFTLNSNSAAWCIYIMITLKCVCRQIVHVQLSRISLKPHHQVVHIYFLCSRKNANCIVADSTEKWDRNNRCDEFGIRGSFTHPQRIEKQFVRPEEERAGVLRERGPHRRETQNNLTDRGNRNSNRQNNSCHYTSSNKWIWKQRTPFLHLPFSLQEKTYFIVNNRPPAVCCRVPEGTLLERKLTGGGKKNDALLWDPHFSRMGVTAPSAPMTTGTPAAYHLPGFLQLLLQLLVFLRLHVLIFPDIAITGDLSRITSSGWLAITILSVSPTGA